MGDTTIRVLKKYALAAMSVLMALLLTLHITPLHQQFKFLMFVLAVVFSATGGIGPGVFATLLSAAMASYFLIPPLNSSAVSVPIDQLRLLIFCGVGLVITWITHHVQQSEQTIRAAAAVVESSADSIMRQGLDNTILSWNKAAEHIYGYTPQEAIGRPVSLIVPPDRRDELQRLVERIHLGGPVHGHETVHIRKDGTHIDVALTLSPIRNRKGRVVAVSSIAREITERKRAETENARLLTAIEQSAEAMVITDTQGTIEYVNPAFTHITGYSRAEVLGQNPRILKSGSHDPTFYQQLWEMILRGKTWQGQIVNRRKDGSRYTEAMTIVPVRDSAGAITNFLAVKEDVTARKLAEDALRVSEERFRKAFNTSPDPITITTLAEGRYLDANESFLRITGHHREEVIDHTAVEIKFWNSLEDRTKLVKILQETGRATNLEINFCTKSGNVRVGLLSGETIELDGQSCFLAVTKDVTEHRQLEEQYRQSQKMEAVGRLAGGIAHDFNNLLTVINGYGEFVLNNLKPDDPNRANLGEIKKAGERAASLTRQLLAFSRQQIMVPQVLVLNSIIDNMDKMLQRLIGEDIDLVTLPGEDLGPVLADPGQMEQIILNLVVNARDAMPYGGKLTLETRNVELDESYALDHLDVKPGPHVLLALSDTGLGMDAETQKHIFEPFFTTKEKGKGTGLGLAMVYGIVKQSRGNIWVYSESGKGTTFKIYLPRVDERIEISQYSKASAGTPAGTETILLVEDEPSVRRLVVETLKLKGYCVLEASKGADAVMISDQHHATVDLLITDVVMPEMGGRVLAQRLAPSRPEMKVLYMSGYTDNAIVHHGVLDQGTAFLQKPFTPDALTRKVREVLDTHRGQGAISEGVRPDPEK